MRRLSVLGVCALLITTLAVVPAGASSSSSTRLCTTFPSESVPDGPEFGFPDTIHLVIGENLPGTTIVVPPGTWCEIVDSTVAGVNAQWGAGALGIFESTVKSDLTIRKGTRTAMAETILHGDYTCARCNLDFLAANDIHGNAKVRGSEVGAFVLDNFIDGDLGVWNITGPMIVAGDPFNPEGRQIQKVGGKLVIRNNTFTESGDPDTDEFSPIVALNIVGKHLIVKGNQGEQLTVTDNQVGRALACSGNSPAPDLAPTAFPTVPNSAKRFLGQCKQ